MGVSRIKLLDDNIISQIAAGEVIEGPSAVIKELCENSLDAGALSISVAVESGGKKLVRVTDDGFGMTPEDLQAAFRRHSTSKIRTAEDLTTVATLGFRGEALASIASVARIEALSKESKETEGYRIYIEGGGLPEFSPAGCAPGTDIAVKDLFFNLPARKKFLKSDQSEARKCFSTFRALTLSKPEVEWKYFQDDKQRLILPPTTLKERISDLFGAEYLEGIVEIDFQESEYRVCGCLGSKDNTHRSREFQYLYLNGRRITDRKLASSVYSAYAGMLHQGDFPYYFLFLEMAPQLVDVNVHPAKLEVRFRYEGPVFGFVKRAVHRALGVESVMMPQYSGFTPRSANYPRNAAKSFETDGKSAVLGRGNKLTLEEYRVLIQPPTEEEIEAQREMDFHHNKGTAQSSIRSFIPENLFQLHDRYIIAQIKSGLVVFDQHAAHERVLYEQALRSLSEGKAPSQKLLFPRFLELPYGDNEIFEEILPWFEKMGFSISPAGPRLYQVETVPSGLKVSDEINLIRGILDYYRENEERREDNVERIAASFACKAAIKAGDKLNPEEMIGLIEALFRTGTSFACPHGRPTYIRIDLSELDRRFGRLS